VSKMMRHPVAREPIEELEHGQHGPRQHGEGDVHIVGQVRVLARGPHLSRSLWYLGPAKELEGVLGLLARRQVRLLRERKTSPVSGSSARAPQRRSLGGLSGKGRRHGEELLTHRRPSHSPHQVDRLFGQGLHR